MTLHLMMGSSSPKEAICRPPINDSNFNVDMFFFYDGCVDKVWIIDDWWSTRERVKRPAAEPMADRRKSDHWLETAAGRY